MAGRSRMSNGSNSYDFQERGDFNTSEFNSCDSPPGPLKKQNQPRDNGNATLHVTNIPSGVDEKGLSNIFSAECNTPARVYISKNRKNVQANTFWGFVEYKTLSEANAAIRAVHKKPPYELCVQFSRATLEGSKLAGEKSPQGNMSPGFRGQGQKYPMRDQSHNNFMATRSNDESFTEDCRESISPCRFSTRGSPAEHNTPNSRERMPGLPIEKYSHVDISDEMDLHVAAYMSNRAKDLTLDDLSTLCSEIKLALPFKPGQCSYCLRTAIYTCSRCKTWYCSDFCRTTHWPQHKEKCAPRTVIFQRDGALTYKDIPDAFCNEDSVKQKSFAARSPRGSQGKNFDSGFRNDSFENSNGHDSFPDFENNTDRVHEKFRDNINTRSPDDNRGASRGFDRGNRSAQKNCRRGGGGGQGQGQGRGGGKQGGGHLDKKYSTNCNKAYENDSVKSPKPLFMDQSKSQNSKSKSLDKAPISPNVFTEVTVGAVGNNGEFWAYKVEDYEKQGALMAELNELSLQSGPADIRIEMGTKCIACYEDGWYRAEIIKIYRDTVRVFFIDFGNESEVKKGDLKLLPPNLSSEPPMAHKYVLAVSSESPVLQEDFSFRIKPIMQDNHGTWVVHAEGVHYHEVNGLKNF